MDALRDAGRDGDGGCGPSAPHMVFGGDRFPLALEHVGPAFRRGSNVTRDRVMEVLVYVSRERQISAALEKVCLREEGGDGHPGCQEGGVY